jgi:hypothetical protein
VGTCNARCASSRNSLDVDRAVHACCSMAAVSQIAVVCREKDG